MRTLVILLDSLNRHLLSAYGHAGVRTPNLDRLAARGIVFDNHYAGSLPCVPARRDFLTGRSHFLETGWGPLEPWDAVLPNLLREARCIYSHLITDHCHYFNGTAGDRYHNSFDSWEYFRGQPWDPWRGVVRPRPEPPGARTYCYGKKYHHQHLANLEYRDREDDIAYSSVQCARAACEFLDRNHADDDWHLHLELFDPHEPFDCPQRYLDAYADDWQGPPLTCLDYLPHDAERHPPEVVARLRRAYAATLTMADHWLGQVLDRLDAHDLWRGTTVILTTDHGLLLGEHGYWAKNYMLNYTELARLPLIVCHPEAVPGRRQALTGAIDLAPTLLALHGVAPPASMTGRSWLPLLAADGPHHAGVLTGYFAREVTVTDGRYAYHRMPLPGSNCDDHFTSLHHAGADTARVATLGRHLLLAGDWPHFRAPRPSQWPHPGDPTQPHLLYDLATDPGQTSALADPAIEGRMIGMLRAELTRAKAPASQFARLSL